MPLGGAMYSMCRGADGPCDRAIIRPTTTPYSAPYPSHGTTFQPRRPSAPRAALPRRRAGCLRRGRRSSRARFGRSRDPPCPRLRRVLRSRELAAAARCPSESTPEPASQTPVSAVRAITRAHRKHDTEEGPEQRKALRQPVANELRLVACAFSVEKTGMRRFTSASSSRTSSPRARCARCFVPTMSTTMVSTVATSWGAMSNMGVDLREPRPVPCPIPVPAPSSQGPACKGATPAVHALPDRGQLRLPLVQEARLVEQRQVQRVRRANVRQPGNGWPPHRSCHPSAKADDDRVTSRAKRFRLPTCSITLGLSRL